MIRKLLGALALVMIWNMPAAAGSDFDFTGNLTYHNDIHYYKIVMQKGADTQLFTTLWLGGNFDPMLAIWTADGELLEFMDDALYSRSVKSNGVSYTFGRKDVRIRVGAGGIYGDAECILQCEQVGLSCRWFCL